MLSEWGITFDYMDNHWTEDEYNAMVNALIKRRKRARLERRKAEIKAKYGRRS